MGIKDCSCKDLINENGFGNCKGTGSPDHNNNVVCYVNHPSNCTDLVDSGTNPGEKFSAQACIKGHLYET